WDYCSSFGRIILVKRNAQDHFKSKEKQDKRAGYSKGVYINPNKIKNLFSYKKENYHQDTGDDGGFFTLNMTGFFPEVNNNGNTSNNINHGKKDHACSSYFANIE